MLTFLTERDVSTLRYLSLVYNPTYNEFAAKSCQENMFSSSGSSFRCLFTFFSKLLIPYFEKANKHLMLSQVTKSSMSM